MTHFLRQLHTLDHIIAHLVDLCQQSGKDHASFFPVLVRACAQRRQVCDKAESF